MEAHLMADGSAASRALGVKEGEAVDDAVVAKKIAAKEVHRVLGAVGSSALTHGNSASVCVSKLCR